MWTKLTNRRALLEIISSRNVSDVSDLKQQEKLQKKDIREGNIMLIWSKKPNALNLLPEMIIVRKSERRDFLAWTATYFPAFSPFTAFSRVITIEDYETLLPKNEILNLNGAEGAFIGAIVGEAITHHILGDLKRITPASVQSTYSFAVASACIRGIIDADEDPITERWERMRKTTGQVERNTNLNDLSKIWYVLRKLTFKKDSYEKNISSENTTIIRACQEIFELNTINEMTWRGLTKGLPDFNEILDYMKDVREKRVISFEKSSIILTDKLNLDTTIGSFLCGYLASEIAPGSMKHWPLLRSTLDRFPTSIVWLGICAGLRKKTDIYNDEEGLGWRIRRDLFREENVWNRTIADISLEELEILLNAERPYKGFRIGGFNQLLVELAPTIYALIPWAVGEKAYSNVAASEKTQSQTKQGIWEKMTVIENLLYDVKKTLNNNIEGKEKNIDKKQSRKTNKKSKTLFNDK